MQDGAKILSECCGILLGLRICILYYEPNNESENYTNKKLKDRSQLYTQNLLVHIFTVNV